MKLVRTKTELQKQLDKLRQNRPVGLVPTMGALHKGHLSLVDKAVSENPTVVVSIFVNPTQFNNTNDLKQYPRNLQADLNLLESSGCQIVFAPEPKEIYPEPDHRKFNFGSLGKVMEGQYRPGHFNGVAQIVSKLFDLIKPQKAYFGMKDFQQLAIIKRMVKMLQVPAEIVACPIVREKNGLAMSSRNELLLPKERENAALIYETLTNAKNLTGQKSVQDIIKWVVETINNNRYLDVEYFEIVDSETLQPVKKWEGKSKKVGCIAVYCGKIRLIDNVVLN